MTIISVPLKQRSVRDSLCVKVADLCGTKSPLQRHQPLKARPPQHSIDLRNKPIFFYKKKRKKKNSMRVCMEPAQTGWAHMIGPRMGPKRGGCLRHWRYIIFLSYEKSKMRWEPSTHWELEERKREAPIKIIKKTQKMEQAQLG